MLYATPNFFSINSLSYSQYFLHREVMDSSLKSSAEVEPSDQNATILYHPTTSVSHWEVLEKCHKAVHID